MQKHHVANATVPSSGTRWALMQDNPLMPLPIVGIHRTILSEMIGDHSASINGSKR
ncbi:hypothetical protein SERLADRAFT_368665 [Serpula lacrymans var. lacrymans S7.9]|uniref:Uncharacterized protein n=1 Tax=Serpula lacrymans var. lacrymans (strain S7.9) TaxID=578457 RepID=F8NUT8_SERL9|nr:uncharacterized protein SERLADRAFT_368665 [Serpula lacrymans var. lacrymans S7.9]EGO25254.1 hypothetical protein SERLADRAFT_368665 [Serpula lacrymans var. lacrymans S7.9]